MIGVGKSALPKLTINSQLITVLKGAKLAGGIVFRESVGVPEQTVVIGAQYYASLVYHIKMFNLNGIIGAEFIQKIFRRQAYDQQS